jgi:hypothetical protein
MDDQRSRILLLTIYEQDNHLTSAFVCPVVWAWAVRVCHTRDLQIKRLHDTKVSTRQLFLDPGKNLITTLIEN